MEPPPKQGCEDDETVLVAGVCESQWNPRRSRGASGAETSVLHSALVSVEPPPKQGCEQSAFGKQIGLVASQWNPRRSRGARTLEDLSTFSTSRLSGTPAEAGVRGIWMLTVWERYVVSVEPPPKQGCENHCLGSSLSHDWSQWNPRRSRGARINWFHPSAFTDASQWNPRRSRGARRRRDRMLRRRQCLSGTPAEAGVREDGDGYSAGHLIVSVEPPPKQGCELPLSMWCHFSLSSQWNPRRSRGARRLI